MTAGAGSIFPVFLASDPSARAFLSRFRGSLTTHLACQTRNGAYLARVSGHAPSRGEKGHTHRMIGDLGP